MNAFRWLFPAAALAVASAALAVTVARPSGAAAQSTPPAGASGTLTVTGQSTLSVPPTEGQITVGVQVNAATASAAVADDAEAVGAIVKALEGAGVPRADLQTENYNLSPNESNATGDQAPRIVDYTISDQIQVTATDLGSVGRLIDIAVGAGANTVNGVNFTVKNPNALLEEANESALAQAHAQALSLAQAAGERLGTLVSLTVNQNASPLPVAFAATAAGVNTTIVAPQSLTVSAYVTAVYSLIP